MSIIYHSWMLTLVCMFCFLQGPAVAGLMKVEPRLQWSRECMSVRDRTCIKCRLTALSSPAVTPTPTHTPSFPAEQVCKWSSRMNYVIQSFVLLRAKSMEQPAFRRGLCRTLRRDVSDSDPDRARRGFLPPHRPSNCCRRPDETKFEMEGRHLRSFYNQKMLHKPQRDCKFCACLLRLG
uniref:Secreted protein n=1 Tax=Kryptolebias marmoratus TaxID=37003 RepID=A0A3Q3AF84_KRYMA